MNVQVTDTRDEQQIALDNYSGDTWLCRDSKSNSWLVVADGICIAIGQPTQEAAVDVAATYVRDNATQLAAEVAALQRRVG